MPRPKYQHTYQRYFRYTISRRNSYVVQKIRAEIRASLIWIRAALISALIFTSMLLGKSLNILGCKKCHDANRIIFFYQGVLTRVRKTPKSRLGRFNTCKLGPRIRQVGSSPHLVSLNSQKICSKAILKLKRFFTKLIYFLICWLYFAGQN